MAYKFIHKLSKFTQEQKNFYETNGYILIKNNVSDEMLDKFCDRFIDICEGRVSSHTTLVLRDPVLRKRGVKGQYVVNKFQDFLYDDVLWEYASYKDVVDIVENIIGPHITAVHSMLINKPPDSHEDMSRHPMHQDLHYFPFRPAHTICASWTAMEYINEDNGCLFVVPGSHTSPLYKHEYPEGMQNKLYHGIQGKDHLPKQFVVMEKGDTVFFHPLILHGSGPNHTKGFRKAISCHYADTNSHFIDVTNTTQEELAKEVMEIARQKGLEVSNVVELWKLKSRLVRGPPGNFQTLDSHL